MNQVVMLQAQVEQLRAALSKIAEGRRVTIDGTETKTREAEFAQRALDQTSDWARAA